MNKLTTKQQRFVDCYIGNATEACRLAGYKGDDNALAVMGNKLMQNRDSESREKRILNRQQLQECWTSIIQDEKIPYKERLKASELLAKSQAIFTDNLQIQGSIEHISDRQLEQQLIKRIHRCSASGLIKIPFDTSQLCCGVVHLNSLMVLGIKVSKGQKLIPDGFKIPD